MYINLYFAHNANLIQGKKSVSVKDISGMLRLSLRMPSCDKDHVRGSD